jgi:hypothetical protein
MLGAHQVARGEGQDKGQEVHHYADRQKAVFPGLFARTLPLALRRGRVLQGCQSTAGGRELSRQNQGVYRPGVLGHYLYSLLVRIVMMETALLYTIAVNTLMPSGSLPSNGKVYRQSLVCPVPPRRRASVFCVNVFMR